MMYATEKEKMEHVTRSFLKSRKLGIVSVTKRCNLSCVYCRGEMDEWYDVLSQNTNNIDLKKNDIPALVEICRKYDFAEILLTGGEPLEYPYFEELISALQSNGIIFSIHTNGFSKKWGRAFTVLRDKKIKPNIHLSSELFLGLQGDIRKCDQLPIDFLKKAVSEEMSVELKITIHKGIEKYVDQLEKTLMHWKMSGVKSFRFQPVVSTGKFFPKNLILDKKSVAIFEKLIDIKKNNREPSSVIRNSIDSFKTLISFLEKTDFHLSSAKKCNIKNQIVFINTDLKIMNCQEVWGKDSSKACVDIFDSVCCSFQ